MSVIGFYFAVDRMIRKVTVDVTCLYENGMNKL